MTLLNRTPTPTETDTAIRTIIGEARGEPFNGQLAVAHVIRTRYMIALRRIDAGKGSHPLFGDGTVTGVCLAPHQFTCWEDANRSYIEGLAPSHPEYISASRAWAEAMAGKPDPTNGATHYFTVARPKSLKPEKPWPPSWAAKMAHKGVIGRHTFYREG